MVRTHPTSSAGFGLINETTHRLRVLVLNAGSSSLKLSLVDDTEVVVAERDFDASEGGLAGARIVSAARDMVEVDAVGHRVVHGGSRYDRSVRIDREVVHYLEGITDLAPLHLPAALAGIAVIAEAMPGVPAVACFDTAFHSHMPDAASTYAIPEAWRERYGIRRYGFHGLSHAYASRRAAEMLRRPLAGLRVVTCHLGAGASLAAVEGGQSVDTTMGFTPLEGLVMATRSGTVDAGLLFYLERHAGLTSPDLEEALDQGGGLLALAGTPDMREVLRRMDEGDDRARLAFEVYVHRLRGLVASMTAAMNGLDALVFTGGVGENSARVRASAADGLDFLGVRVDPARNETVQPDDDISTHDAVVRTLVIKAHEDLEVAREVRKVLGG